MDQQLAGFLRGVFPDASAITIEALEPIPGGFSRETWRFDARVVHGGGDEHVVPLILRKDPPRAAALLHTSRMVEHHLLESVRAHTAVPVSQSYGYELDPTVFGEPAMIIHRMPGSGQTSNLFHDGPHTDQVDDVVRHLCEVMAELHQTDVSKLDPHGHLADPRGVGIDTTSWDTYMDSTYEYYVNSYRDIDFDPAMMVYLDAYLTLRRNRPRPLRLSLVHGDFNPANFLYEDGRVTALIDWENSRIGDPREDLGWMVTMDLLSNTKIMEHPADRGGFLAYYNELTGFGVTPEELAYFALFGTANVAVPVASAVQRRIAGEHQQFLHLYILQASSPNLVGFAQLLGYPGTV